MDTKDFPEVSLGWKQRMDLCGATVKNIKSPLRLTKKDGSFLFTFLEIDATDPSGTSILPYLLIRGSAVIIVPEVICTSTGQKYLLMVKQWRSGTVDFTWEFPAGMVEKEPSSINLLECATREMHEETGTDLTTDNLTSLWPCPLYPAPSLCDEGLYYFKTTMYMSPEKRNHLCEQSFGKAEEGESTRVHFFPLPLQIENFSTLATVSGYFMYLNHPTNK